MHPIRFLKIYYKDGSMTYYRRFGEWWEDTEDSATIITTIKLCEIAKELYYLREDIIGVTIDDNVYNKDILIQLY